MKCSCQRCVHEITIVWDAVANGCDTVGKIIGETGLEREIVCQTLAELITYSCVGLSSSRYVVEESLENSGMKCRCCNRFI